MNKMTQGTPTTMSIEDYIRLEQQSLHRHEFVNGQLIEMPGEKDINNEIAGLIYVFFIMHVKSKGFSVYMNDVKVGLPDKTKYYYPDVFITREAKTEANQYIKYEPELIVEVVSPSTHITDTVDKYMAYTTIPSLKYYLIVEPETVYVTLYSKNSEGKWEAMSYVRKTDVIPLPLLELSMPLEEVYK
jgi:Uma2 family endonuclease